MVYPYYDDALPVQELGASIFVSVNKNLMRAVAEFNLTLIDLQDEDDDFGLWDGQQLVVTVSLQSLPYHALLLISNR